MENFTNQNYHGNYKKMNNRNKYTPPKYVLQGGRSSGTSAGDTVDELPNEPTVDTTQVHRVEGQTGTRSRSPRATG